MSGARPDGVPAPVVGISAYATEAVWGGRSAEVALLPMAYVRAVGAAGGAPVLLPPGSDAGAVIERIDALVLAGGPDVDPARYGAARHPRTQPAVPARDEFEARLLALAAERGLPVLCICRGVQLLNVVRGGTLHQHLPDVLGSDRHDGEDSFYTTTEVRIAPASRLGAALGSASSRVSCHHHQAVDRLGRGLVPVAWAPDGTIEALEDPGEPTLLAVQWHPEEGDDPALFAWLVDAAGSQPPASLTAVAGTRGAGEVRHPQ